MASAIVRGVVSSGFMQPSQITVSSPSFSQELQRMKDDVGITLTDIGTGVNKADLVIIAVKPAVIPKALGDNMDSIHSKQVFLSVCAGTSCQAIEEVCCYW